MHLPIWFLKKAFFWCLPFSFEWQYFDNSFDKGLMTGMIPIIFKRSLTMYYDILLQKLYFIGIQTHTVNWFKSYLFNRSFLVNLGNNFSQTASVSCGVTKNSILWQFYFMFLTYVNDASQVLKHDIFLFSNGSCLSCQHKSINKIKKQLN